MKSGEKGVINKLSTDDENAAVNELVKGPIGLPFLDTLLAEAQNEKNPIKRLDRLSDIVRALGVELTLKAKMAKTVTETMGVSIPILDASESALITTLLLGLAMEIKHAGWEASTLN